MFTVENLAVRLGDKNILQNVHFTIDTPGQLVGILGANGSGKTTLLRAVAGLLPHTGCCLMDGVPLESLSTSAWHKRSVTSRSKAEFQCPCLHGKLC